MATHAFVNRDRAAAATLRPALSDRFIRVCASHGRVLQVEKGDRLRCPEGHRINAYGGSWAVLDRHTGALLAVANTDAIMLADVLAQGAGRLALLKDEIRLPARTRASGPISAI